MIIISIKTSRHEHTVQSQTRMFLEKQSVEGLHGPLCEKNGLRGFDLVPHRPGCTAIEDG